MTLRAVVFDLGGTLVDFPEWDERAAEKWSRSYDALVGLGAAPPPREEYVKAMREAELAHWARVEAEQWSGPPTGIVADGFRRLHLHPTERELLVALDGYARAIAGWSRLYPDTVSTLGALRGRGLRLGLLSNTWWAAEWHNADLAAHGVRAFLDEVVYTSDLPHSKPHEIVFREVLGRLGVAPEEAVMIGDRLIDDVSGAQALGMRAVWKRNDATPRREGIAPDAAIDALAELPPIIERWAG